MRSLKIKMLKHSSTHFLIFVSFLALTLQSGTSAVLSLYLKKTKIQGIHLTIDALLSFVVLLKFTPEFLIPDYKNIQIKIKYQQMNKMALGPPGLAQTIFMHYVQYSEIGRKWALKLFCPLLISRKPLTQQTEIYFYTSCQKQVFQDIFIRLFPPYTPTLDLELS